MSRQKAQTPEQRNAARTSPIDQVIVPRARDLGGLEVRRALPAARRQMVGPFIFFDQMGPAELPTGDGIDVWPHPHIGLATITWLLDGEIMHRDSLGTAQIIRPGEVNWMIAGRGIAHSERTPDDLRAKTRTLAGLQSWIALPKDREEIAPCTQRKYCRRFTPLKRLERLLGHRGMRMRIERFLHDLESHRYRRAFDDTFACDPPTRLAAPRVTGEALLAAVDRLGVPAPWQRPIIYVAPRVPWLNCVSCLTVAVLRLRPRFSK